MARSFFLISAAGKIAAVLLWSQASLRPVAAVLFFVPDFVVLYHIFVPSAQGLGRVFTHFETGRAEIWLTIDDGPDGEDTLRILELLDRHRARGLRCVGWSVRSYDSLAHDPDRVVRRVMQRVRPGSIVLMHEGSALDRRVRVRALERLLGALAAQGLACVLPGAEQLR